MTAFPEFIKGDIDIYRLYGYSKLRRLLQLQLLVRRGDNTGGGSSTLVLGFVFCCFDIISCHLVF
jgi:hypothetical protein